MSRDVTSGRRSRPRHPKVLYFPHRRLWIMEYSCMVWCKPCRRRLILRQHSRHSWRLKVSPLWEDTWWFRMLDDYGKVLEVRKQRPQDQGLSETSAASPSSGSGSSASYRKTMKASSPSSSASTIWTPTLIPTSSDVDTNFSDLHALQSQISGSKLAHPLGRDRENPSSELCKDPSLEASIRRFKASSGNLLHQEGSWNIGEDFPNCGVVGDDTLAEEATETDSECGD
ncbi:hypothetical protein Taro_048269 [Colocasia esculenta]|uniref:Uncharacterized protein n=1 Tax=Colocasia esculenta TaxID=4460 RepID=A0A843X2J0_COLES|nr:hypothetical protein [Colocasia esculenta]